MKHYPVQTGNFAKVRSYQKPTTQWQARARIVGYDVSNPEFFYRQNSITGVVTRCRYMELFTNQLELIIKEAAQLGALKALITTGQLKPYLKKSEAFRLYGRKEVSQWLTDNLITPRKDGNHSASWRLERMELETVSRAQRLLIHIN